MGKTIPDGAFTPADGSYGLRLELKGSRFLLLWRNSPVLDTKYKLLKDGILKLNENGLRYAADQEPYATVTSCRLENEKIVLTEYFPISGDSVTALARTEDSRYGRVTVETEKVLPELQGKWEDPGYGAVRLEFKGDRVTVNGQDTEEIAVVRYKGETAGRYMIVNKDPSKDYICFLLPMDYDGSTIRTGFPVCDAPTVYYDLRKKRS